MNKVFLYIYIKNDLVKYYFSKLGGHKMKKDKQWKQPEINAVKQRNTSKLLASSRKGQVRYSTGIGPKPQPPMNPDLV